MDRRSLGPVLAVGVVVAGCHPDRAPLPGPVASPPVVVVGSAAAPSEVEVGGVEPRVAFNLDQADLTDLMRAFTQVMGQPVAVDPAAQPAAGCARITIHSGDPVAPSRVPGLVDGGLAAAGFSLRAAPGGFLLERRVGAVREAWEVDGGARPRCAREQAEYFFGARPDREGPEEKAPGEEVLAAGIRVISENEREIREATRAAIAGDLGGVVLDQVRLVPEREGDALRGVRLFGVKAEGLVGKLGFENGDRVVSFGAGLDAGPAAALVAVEGMKRGNAAVIRVERHGRAVELRYRVVP